MFDDELILFQINSRTSYKKLNIEAYHHHTTTKATRYLPSWVKVPSFVAVLQGVNHLSMSRPLFQFEAFCIGWYELKYDLNFIVWTNNDTCVFTVWGWSVAKWQQLKMTMIENEHIKCVEWWGAKCWQLTMSIFNVWGWSVAKWWQLKMMTIENEYFNCVKTGSCKVTTIDMSFPTP